MGGLLLGIAGVLIVLWLVGLLVGILFHLIIGPVIHLALIIGIIALVIHLLGGRGRTRV